MTRFVQCASLDEVRQQIDRVDRELVALVAERGNFVRQAAGFKIMSLVRRRFSHRPSELRKFWPSES